MENTYQSHHVTLPFCFEPLKTRISVDYQRDAEKIQLTTVRLTREIEWEVGSVDVTKYIIRTDPLAQRSFRLDRTAGRDESPASAMVNAFTCVDALSFSFALQVFLPLSILASSRCLFSLCLSYSFWQHCPKNLAIHISTPDRSPASEYHLLISSSRSGVSFLLFALYDRFFLIPSSFFPLTLSSLLA